MRRFWIGLSVSGAALALVVHVLAIFGVTLLDPSFDEALLIVLAITSWCAFISRANASSPSRPERATSRDVFARIPNWGRALVLLAFMYAGVNFWLSARNPYAGSLVERADGQYYLIKDRHFVRDLDDDGVRAANALGARIISGHLLLFLLLPALYFRFAAAESRSTQRMDRRAM